MEPKGVVVLVHGFESSARTWDPLKSLLEADEEVTARYDIECFEYPTSLVRWIPWRSIPTLRSIGQTLESFLETSGIQAYDHIVLIGHSLGGLVIETFLTQKVVDRHGSSLAKIRQVVTIATPHLGSGTLSVVRDLVSRFSRSPQEVALRAFSEDIGDM